MNLHDKTKALEAKIKSLENKVKTLEDPCKYGHNYETVGGLNNNYVIYFNMCNAYIKCINCRKRKAV